MSPLPLSNRCSLKDNLDALLQHYQPQAFRWQQPDEWRLDQQLQQWAARQQIPCHAVNREHFYTARHDAVTSRGGQRRRTGLAQRTGAAAGGGRL
ncbi:cryptochrome/photolyase family protein [Crenobacter sp. SG2303]|uniref:Cryptochrome/photolyase family protein n=1 Tax=Crenobacter oryzisoli TaxID=3056844 RepID=A0ABT7XSP5_9NEIS|nr:cryptochrome/photolyase family protein [Crenobacter sp. SG2303]MDN0076819.1 cryptochrome/photolyase family protein [Crenobacter sp. SG2303]